MDSGVSSSEFISQSSFTKNRIGPRSSSAFNSSIRVDETRSGGAVFLGSVETVGDSVCGNLSTTVEEGGIFCEIESSIFQANDAGQGGAITFMHGSLLSMDSVTFLQNVGTDGGALFLSLDGDQNPRKFHQPANYANLRNLAFTENKAARGAGLFLNVGSLTSSLRHSGVSPYQISSITSNGDNNNEDDVFLENAVFNANSASDCGGALFIERGRIGCLNSSFIKNIVGGNSGGDGGAFFLTDQSALHGRNVSFFENSATNGGAIYADNSLVDVITGNFDANIADQNGGGLFIGIDDKTDFEFGLASLIERSILMKNKAESGGEYT